MIVGIELAPLKTENDATANRICQRREKREGEEEGTEGETRGGGQEKGPDGHARDRPERGHRRVTERVTIERGHRETAAERTAGRDTR